MSFKDRCYKYAIKHGLEKLPDYADLELRKLQSRVMNDTSVTDKTRRQLAQICNQLEDWIDLEMMDKAKEAIFFNNGGFRI
jgi:hypothetical protein